MPTTLRIGFAMGGGVSLGTFCGAALSQALKLMVLHGRDRQGQPYQKVEVDVFSGASAGALSLAAMLRYLAQRTPEQEQKAWDRLQAEFGNALNALDAGRRSDLIAAQVVQDMQELLWSDEITLDKLLGTKGDSTLPFKASILDRGAVEDIARRFVLTWPDGINLQGKRLLADRVLYACALANLTPIVADASAEFPGAEVGFIGLADGMRSFTHRDMRVFDLNLTKTRNPGNDEVFPQRWCLYHNGPAQAGLIGDLRQPQAWAQMAATAIASGCFPFAFEPAVLNRKAFEFGPRLWCKTFGVDEDAFDGQKIYPFTYVDGGTFNNEPIREAFRMASFIDGHPTGDATGEVERLIVFVDPFVSDPLPDFRVAVHQAWQLEAPNVFGSLDGYDLRRRTSLDRLLPHLGTLFAAVSNQGRVLEGDKIFQVRHLFELRKGIRESLHNTLMGNAAHEQFQKLMTYCQERLRKDERDDLIPPGPLTLEGELERVAREEPSLTSLRGRAKTWIDGDAWETDQDAGLWLRALSYVAVDLILSLEGKREHTRLVAIAPFRNLVAGVNPQRIDLPGGRLSGFAGFMSKVPDQVEFRAARYCAAEFLRACGVLPATTPLPPSTDLALTDEEWRNYQNDVEKGMRLLADRVGDMVTACHLIQMFPGLDWLLRQVIAKIVEGKVRGVDWRGKNAATCEFLITVPNERFELDGAGLGDADSKPVKNQEDGSWQLITFATYDFEEAKWSGGFVRDGRLHVDTDGTAFLPDKSFCQVEMPSLVQVQTAKFVPNPIFAVELKSQQQGTIIKASKWILQPGVRALEDSLLD